MNISYEAVAYGLGEVTKGDPEGFGFEHYDQTPSSLQSGDGTTQQGPSFNERANLEGSQIYDTVSKQLNTYQNTKENQNVGNIKSLTSQSASSNTGGLQGFSFPVSTTTDKQTVVASQSQIGR